MSKPHIFSYVNYREFLKDYYVYRKKADRSFTHRYIIENVGATSSGWFSDIVKGRINLSTLHRLRLAELCNFSESENHFFSNLVEYDQAGSFEERKIFFKRIIAIKEPDAKVVLEHQFDFYRLWYVSAIRELLLTYKFDGNDFSELADQLCPKITSDEAQYAINLLIDTKLLIKDGDYYAPTSNNIKKSSGYSSFYWKLYMESMLNQSFKALDYSKDIRDYSAITLNLNASNFSEAKLLVSECRRKILQLQETNRGKSRVFQCNFQLFPLSEEFSGM